MGALTSLLDVLGPVGLLLVAATAIIALLGVDKAMGQPLWVIAGLIAAKLLSSVDETISTLVGAEDVGAIPILGPIETTLVLAIVLFALARPHPRPGPPLLWGSIVAFLGLSLLLDTLNTGSLNFDMFLRLLVVTAIWRAPSLDIEFVTRGLQALLGFMLLGSFATWMLGLPGAVESYSGGGTAILPFRVSGTLPHPNGLGPIAVLWLLLDQFRPLPPRWRAGMNTVAVALLVASQSKTAWAQALFVVLALHVARESNRRQVQTMVLAGVAAAAALLLTGFELTEVLGTDAARQLTSLTGRTEVWAAGLREWRETNVLTGAGGDVFRLYAARTGQSWAGQAHNQIIETLAAHGLLGLTVLLTYMSALVRVAWETRPISRNASLALVGALLLRSMTETPLDSLGTDHLATLLLLFAWQRALAHDAPTGQALVRRHEVSEPPGVPRVHEAPDPPRRRAGLRGWSR